ncbi:metallophosphoesterase [Lutibacter sp.]|uniref:metallophosphoesterase n=1 Tax=Lutibacter sp. TaxID=1925666 RepID=UPI001A330558|nr:metallophosphoesterase [Lutibacter sp.]MBI9042778.1 metallophosphoesterase [Lutibacter sp.]
MVRIIQLSDFHINPKNLNDWKNYIKKALLNKLENLNKQKDITFIAFTGDLINVGGAEFNSAEEAFETFNNEIIKPIINNLNIPIDKFLIIPGNHDIIRSEDSKRDEIGSKNYFTSLESISEFITNALEKNDFGGMKRMIAFKNFEKKLYSAVTVPHKLTMFGSSFIITNDNGLKIGIACLNSAWRCYDNNDKGNLIIGENQLIEHTNFIEDTDLKVALIHHPIDTLSKVEAKLILDHLHKDYNLLLLGDSHETITSMSIGFTGTLFTNLAPSGMSDIRNDSRRYSNGFTVIDVDLNGKEVCAQYFRYNHNKKDYVIDTDSGNTDDGKFCQEIPDKQRKKNIGIVNKGLDNIRDNHYKSMNDCMIGVKVDINVSCIKEAFILPPITQGKSLSDENEAPEINLNQIIKANYHQMFFGNKESGKTVLLYRLVREFVDEYQYTRKLPIYFNIEEIGNKEIETVLKEYLSFNTLELKELISNNDIVLLVDNLNYKDNGNNIDRLKKLEAFLDANPNILVISTGDGDISSGVPPIEYVEYCKIPFKSYFIQNLRSKEIKSIIKLWIPTEDGIKMEDRLDKIVDDFSSFSLPSNAMSVSLFLWSTEHSDRKPINNAVLLDIYIEIILEKLNQDNIYRGSFDFTNKLQLLANIAQEMLVVGEDDYSLKYSEYLIVIESYLILVGFDYEPDKIAEYFIRRKIFTKYQGNRIKFAQSCFFHFFLAKRMDFNLDFKAYVMDEENYCKFIPEIDFFTGLVRSDKQLLNTVYERFKSEFSKTDNVFPQLENIWDRFFIIKLKEDDSHSYKFESAAKKTEISKIKENRPSKEMIEEFRNRRLAKITEPGKILKKNGNINLESLIILMSIVLRNSEGVEDIKLKKDIYSSLIKYTLVWTALYREHIIDYILKHNKLPPTLPTNISVQKMLVNLPLHIQSGMSKWLGTPKLAKVILSKIESDSKGNSFTKSDLESFFSVALYADIQGRDYPKYYKNLIKKLKNTPVRDYALYKLIYYYYRRTRDGSPNEELYLDMISDLKMKELNMPNKMKQKVINSYKTAKKNILGN